MKKVYLIAKKLGHSFSPLIHGYLADYDYLLKELNEDELENFLKKREFHGLNVTIPYKTEVMKYLDFLSPEAEEIGAVNTVLNKDGKLYGYNTDYFGFCYMVKSMGLSLSGKDVVIIGSGGASKPIFLAAYKMGAKNVRILTHAENKTGSIEKFYDCDILINTTPVGMYPDTGVSPVDIEKFKKCTHVLDIIYNPAKTKLQLDAEREGKITENGMSMLVAQAKRGCEIFTKTEIDDGKIEEIKTKIEKMTKNIILIGMPGSGKTTIGKALSKKMGRDFKDTDEEISAMGRTPKEIIEARGEGAFRKTETEVLSKLSKESRLVISTGGGIVTKDENLDLCRQNSVTVFIERDLEKLDVKNRPLSRGGAALSKLYNERISLYNKFSDIKIANDTTIEDAVEKIIKIFIDR